VENTVPAKVIQISACTIFQQIDCRLFLFLKTGKVQGRFALVISVVNISAIADQKFNDVEVSTVRRIMQRGAPFFIRVPNVNFLLFQQ
jgi:hypothetical protein